VDTDRQQIEAMDFEHIRTLQYSPPSNI